MGRFSRAGVVSLVAILVVVGLTGCERAKAGGRCNATTSDFGFDATHVLQCKSGRWSRIMTIAAWARLDIHNLDQMPTLPEVPSTPLAPPTSGPITGAVQVAVGNGYACARLVGGTIRCWGDNSYGQLGAGVATATIPTASLAVVGMAGATDVAVGPTHACAVASGGSVWCWGGGTLNDGTAAQRTAFKVSLAQTATEVVVGNGHTCVLLSDATVACSGGDALGQLGDGQAGQGTGTMTTVPGLTGVKQLSGSRDNTCALLSDATVQCWGSNAESDLGIGVDGGYRAVPTPVVGVSGATAVSVGASHSCVLLAGGTAKCWGTSLGGGLGNPADSAPAGTVFPSRSATPVDVVGLSGARDLAAGAGHSCANSAGGVVSCWGDPLFGQTARIGDRDSVVRVVDGVTGKGVAAGWRSTCVLGAYGTVSCWGSNASGELGRASTSTDPQPTPGLVVVA